MKNNRTCKLILQKCVLTVRRCSKRLATIVPDVYRKLRSKSPTALKPDLWENSRMSSEDGAAGEDNNGDVRQIVNARPPWAGRLRSKSVSSPGDDLVRDEEQDNGINDEMEDSLGESDDELSSDNNREEVEVNLSPELRLQAAKLARRIRLHEEKKAKSRDIEMSHLQTVNTYASINTSSAPANGQHRQVDLLSKEPLDPPAGSLSEISTNVRNIACAGSLPLGSGAANVLASQPGENVEAGHRAQIQMSDIRSGESPGDCLPVRRERACEDYRGTVATL